MKAASRSPQETFEWGRRLGAACRGGETFALSGELGAGKTVFAKGIAAGLGIDPESVRSPTFVLMEVHGGRGARAPLAHADAYRVEDAAAFARDGWDDLAPAVRAVEWAERVAAILPGDACWIRLAVRGESEREISFEGPLPAGFAVHFSEGAL